MLIASGVPEKSADFWGALQIVAIVVNQIFLADSATYLGRFYKLLYEDFAVYIEQIVVRSD